jgi:hypothetical protein
MEIALRADDGSGVVDDATRPDDLQRAFDPGKGFAEPSGAGVLAA